MEQGLVLLPEPGAIGTLRYCHRESVLVMPRHSALAPALVLALLPEIVKVR